MSLLTNTTDLQQQLVYKPKSFRVHIDNISTVFCYYAIPIFSNIYIISFSIILILYNRVCIMANIYLKNRSNKEKTIIEKNSSLIKRQILMLSIML